MTGFVPDGFSWITASSPQSCYTDKAIGDMDKQPGP